MLNSWVLRVVVVVGGGLESIPGWQRCSLGMQCWDLGSVELSQPFQKEPQMYHAAMTVAFYLHFIFL